MARTKMPATRARALLRPALGLVVVVVGAERPDREDVAIRGVAATHRPGRGKVW